MEKTNAVFADGASSTKSVTVEPFTATMEKHGLSLVRGQVQTLQINTGLLCNLRCRHCHLEAGPDRREVMSRETMAATISFAERFRFQAIDITGGAPEMVPDLPFLIEGLAPLAPRLMLRTNLAAGTGAGSQRTACRRRRSPWDSWKASTPKSGSSSAGHTAFGTKSIFA